MKIEILGNGSAFTMKSFQSNILISDGGQSILIDAGTDIRFSLAKSGRKYSDINAAYLTHQHADHIGGVEYLAFCSYFDPSVTEKIKLYGNKDLIVDAWNHSLSGGLESIQSKVHTLEDYFDVNPIEDNGHFYWNGNLFEIVQTVHIMNGRSIVKTYGVMITTKELNKVYITGDTQFCPNQIMDFYKEADLIIQDCETYPFKSGVHANYLDLKTLPDEIKSKMMLIHMNDNIFDSQFTISDERLNSVISDGFKGFCDIGGVYEI